MSDWRAQLGDRLISAEAAAAMVKSGDTVLFTIGREAQAVGLAIAARMGELENVHVVVPSPGYDFGWYDDGWQDAFEVVVGMPTGVCQEGIDERRIDLNPGWLWNYSRPLIWLREPDILLVEISAPDARGFVSFGNSLWQKRMQVREARKLGKPVIAEVNEKLIRTYGDNFMHISEFDYFVEHASQGSWGHHGTLAGRPPKPVDPWMKDLAGYVSELIRDGDCLQIGVGRTTEPLVSLGVFDNRRDLGYHSEATAPGIIGLARKGIINGSRKSVRQGKVVVTSLGGGTREEMEWAHDNPIFEILDLEDVVDIRNIAANDNMVAINNVLAVDLTGQVSAETLGGRILSIAGGQVPFVIGCLLSKGGRVVHVLPSTALGGTVSRIVPELPGGSTVTIPRYCMDCVVTEYGIARLWGKSLRQRAEQLIAIAHPDFRAELTTEARRRLWP